MENEIVDNTIYHYTSFENAIKILQAYSLWQTDAAYFNDPTELIYGLDIVKEVFENYFQDEKIKAELADSYSHFAGIGAELLLNFSYYTKSKTRSKIKELESPFFKSLLKQRTNAKRAKVRFFIDTSYFFIVSFSKHCDSLYMWNSYCNGGKGVAIGFDYTLLNEIYCGQINRLLVQVNYRYYFRALPVDFVSLNKDFY